MTASWAKPSGSTQAMVAIASVVYGAPTTGIASTAALAHAVNAPVTWLDADLSAVIAGASYDQYHSQYGDDISTTAANLATFKSALPWVGPSVAYEGVDAERQIAADTSVNDYGFWGIAWNSHGVDGTQDEGSPWGSYCADPTSYKRPSPQSSCSLVSLEWTARDLTRAYLANREDIFSTDPDDVTIRGGMDIATASGYEKAVVDAYAAAGQTQPLVMVLQQESTETQANPADIPILRTLYQEAVSDGFKPVTLAQAAAAQITAGAQTRAIAFPGIPISGYGAVPATIDFHDAHVGMTFVAGNTAPARIFEYDQEDNSIYNVGIPRLTQMPKIATVIASNNKLTFHIVAPVATEYGVAIWSDPTLMGYSGSNIFPTAHAGAVVIFNLPAGTSDQSIQCSACSSTTFAYST
jgi:hypothetical protein